MNKKHCKAECNEIGICPTCGDVFDGKIKSCPMEIYDPFDQWICSETKMADRVMIALIAVAGCAGIAKFIGWW